MKKLALMSLLSLSLSLPILAGEVSLLRAQSTVGSKYGMVWQNTKFIVKAQNTSPSQQVQIIAGEQVIEAEFVKSIDQRFSLWQAKYSFSNRINGEIAAEQPRDLNFLVQSVDGDVIDRDDNNGQNYQLAMNGGSLLSNETQVMLADYNLYNDGQAKRFTGVINIKNVDYSKNVKVIYTTDHWKNVNEANAQFEPYYNYGYTCEVSPNALGVENWTFAIPLSSEVKSVEFAIVYQVSGAEYWDNNFGANYIINKDQ